MNFVSPRPGSTGVQITKGGSMLFFSLDYLAFTSKSLKIEDLEKRLQGDDLIKLEKGKLGYKQAYLYKKCYIYYDGSENMGIHFDCPSKGLFYAKDFFGLPNIGRDFKFTRIDLALDVKDRGLFDLIKMATSTGNLKTRWKSWRTVEERTTVTNELLGRTIYFGSRKSEVMLRVYDKALEQGLQEDWTRLELEIKGDSAQNCFEKLRNYPISELMPLILNNYIDFIDKKANSNVSRCPRLDWWAEIIENSEKTTIAPSPAEKDFGETYSWLLKQTSKSLAKVAYFDQLTDSSLLKGLEEIGQQKINLQDKLKIQDYIKEGGL